MRDHDSENRRDGRTLPYQAPAVEERESVSAPLNTVAQSGPRELSPRWQPESD
jgi:hypothetical protein